MSVIQKVFLRSFKTISGKMNTTEALRPVTRIFQLFGLSVTAPCKFKNISSSRIIKCYSFLLIALRIGVFVHSIAMNRFVIRSEGTIRGLTTTIDVALMSGIRLLEIIILVEAFVKIRQEKQFMQNFLEIDNIIMHHFNIDLKSHELKLSTIKRLIIWVCTFGTIVSVNLFLAYTHSSLFFYYAIYAISFTTASFTYFQIIIWADLIRYRLHIVNRVINDLNNEQNKIMHQKSDEIILNKSNGVHSNRKTNGLNNNNVNNNNVDTIYEANVFNQFGIICDLYDRLWVQTNLINERFKCAMVLNIGNDFVLLVSNIYYFFDCLRYHPCPMATTFIFFLSTILNIFHVAMLSRTCHHTSDEAILIAHGIHKNSMVINNKKFSSFVSNRLYHHRISIEFSLMYSTHFRFKISHCNCFTKNYVSTHLDFSRLTTHSYLW